MIAYHGTPMGGQRVEVARFLAGRHALVSFAYPEDIPIVAEATASFVLDNGAFTFWQEEQKAKEKGLPAPPPVDWEKYVEWVASWSGHPGYDWCLIPDVIDGTEDDNWRLMFHFGRRLPFGVPVYHMHESFGHLERLIKNYPRIAIGSSGQWPTPGTGSWWARMAEVMNVVCDADGVPKPKLHGLRMLNPEVFSRLPLSSADSTNAARNSHESKRFGMYMPPTSAQRAEVIASRIEYHNSAAVWVPPSQMQMFGT